MIKNEKIDLAILFLLSIILSLYLFFQTYVISLDGAFQYIPIAKDFASGLFGKALNHTQQPLYSILTAFISQWISDFESAGKWVSTLFGILMIFPVYFLGKRIFDDRIAFLSTLLLVIHPYIRRFSADVLKESTYLFFLATTLWFAWRTIQNEKKYTFLFIPLFSVLAYLVRPDGLEVLLIIFFYILFVKEFSIPGRKRTAILLLLLSSVILLLPYLFNVKEIRGEWSLSKAKSIGAMLGLERMGDEIPFTYKIFYSFWKLNLEIFYIFPPVYIFLLIIGLLKGIFSRLKTGEGLLLSFCALHYVVLFFMVMNTTQWGADKTVLVNHLSARHVLPLFLISIYWIGEGFLAIYHWVYKKVESNLLLLGSGPEKKSIIIMVSLLILILAIVLPKTLKPQRYERLPEKWAGLWIKDQSAKEATLLTTLPRVAYYAGLKYDKNDTLDKVKTPMVEGETLYLALRGRDLADYPIIVESINRNFIEVIRYEKEEMEKVIVYKRVR